MRDPRSNGVYAPLRDFAPSQCRSRTRHDAADSRCAPRYGVSGASGGPFLLAPVPRPLLAVQRVIGPGEAARLGRALPQSDRREVVVPTPSIFTIY